MAAATDEVSTSLHAVLQDAFTNKISLQTATKELASVSLSNDTTTEGGLNLLWNLIVTSARDSPEYQDMLVDILVHLSKLPDAKTEQGEPLILYNMQVWEDLPMLSWKFRDEWNKRDIPSNPPDRRQKAISDLINMDKFVAHLMATNEPVFAYSWFALLTFRTALETPLEQLLPTEPLDAYIPAAAAWIEILGVEIYEWDEEFESGPLVGAPGRGGPLWKGKHAFCEERWTLWRERFEEVARMEGELGEEARTAAREAGLMMREIENGDVE